MPLEKDDNASAEERLARLEEPYTAFVAAKLVVVVDDIGILPGIGTGQRDRDFAHELRHDFLLGNKLTIKEEG